MASKGNAVDAIDNIILEKCMLAGKAALKSAMKEIQKDFKNKVVRKTVQEYYNDYKPVKYKRTDGIEPAFDVFSMINGDGLTGFIRLEYDYRNMPQHYSNSPYHQKAGRSSNSAYSGGWVSRTANPLYYPNQKNFGMPENGWIFQNFMEGIHPDGSSDYGDGGSYGYQFEPSYLRIKKHIQEYASSNGISNILVKHFKKHIKRYL